jgi:peptidyl-prolyl cis-trans isomerase C
MKCLLLSVLFSAFVYCQTPPAPKITPGTPAPPQPQAPDAPAPATAAPPVAPDTVVLESNGKKYTAADVDKMIASLPPQIQQNARMQPQIFGQLFVYQQLAEDAEKAGLDKQEPWKSALEFQRMQTLANAQLTTHSNTIQVTTEDEQAYYQKNPDKYRQAKVRVIYISFNPAPDKTGAQANKLPTEAEAKAKIEDLRKQILAGADFGKLARENSNDEASAAKDGDFGIIKRGSSYPDAVKNAVFALQAGQVSEPLRQPNGFYLIRVDQFTMEPFDDVHTQIFQEVKQQRFNEWVSAIQAQYKVKVENPAYFTPHTAPQLQPVR